MSLSPAVHSAASRAAWYSSPRGSLQAKASEYVRSRGEICPINPLCQTTTARYGAKLVDSDPERYSVETLGRWRTVSESAALQALENYGGDESNRELLFVRLEQLMPYLLAEMRVDLSIHSDGSSSSLRETGLTGHRAMNSRIFIFMMTIRSLTTSSGYLRTTVSSGM